MESNIPTEAHDATVRALLYFVDTNIGKYSSEEEWKEAFRRLGDHLNTHEGFVQCDHSRLWSMLGKLVAQDDRPTAAPIRDSSTRSSLLSKGSNGIKADYLGTVGFIRDDVDELTMDGHYDGGGEVSGMLDRVVAKAALTTARPCE